MKMTVELFDSIINTSQDCVFWKDKDRRFVGVNQAFLDFYGFESVDVLIGKTDEDMGWHNDPEPYKNDELRVLAGDSTYKVHGKCMVRGEERDIIASKRPLYDGDEIVGLVGSFSDVTDVVRRQGRMDGLQIVYTVEKLRRIPYFDRLLDETALDEILDPLTGVISRAYAMDYVHSLISSGTPFSFTIIDLDNFKFINDTFGHGAGDIVLKTVTKSLGEYLGENGIIGRFGGDELLMVNLRVVDFSSRLEFFRDMYEKDGVLRRNVHLDKGSTFVTGTSGSASFPEDADNYTDLFGLIDKTLYLGKSKGRNCYVVYEEEKHGGIEIEKLVKHNIYNDMLSVQKLFEKGDSLREKLNSVLSFLKDRLQINDLYYVDGCEKMKSVVDDSVIMDVKGIKGYVSDDLKTISLVSDNVENDAPYLYKALKSRDMLSTVVVRIGDTDRFTMCGVKRRFRIWQENECAILYFLTNLILAYGADL